VVDTVGEIEMTDVEEVEPVVVVELVLEEIKEDDEELTGLEALAELEVLVVLETVLDNELEDELDDELDVGAEVEVLDADVVVLDELELELVL